MKPGHDSRRNILRFLRFEQRRRLMTPRSMALFAALLAAVFCRSAQSDDEIGIQAPEGFDVSLYADDDLAHDIFSMTVDSLGRVVVSGQGYVRILIDADGDGRAESFKQYADGPTTGAQGLHFHGRDLLCSGDGGLIRYRDQNGDDRADGPPEVFIHVKAGGEHDAHAIRKGPDGWWYVLCGNMAGVNQSYISLPQSPVKSPEFGTLLRLRPDLAGGEVVAHGYRNSYDFDFSPIGDAFTFDSDGEREISLPWYQPTRVFLMAPGSHAGWFSHNWKRSADYFDVPPAIAEFGRGSPTGVAFYRHSQFPAAFRNAMFVLDWTYGRVFALPMQPDGSSVATRPIPFLSAIGEHGFAPTDVEIGPDGSLFVCVGGRGTRGSVYRITATGAKTRPFTLQGVSQAQMLHAILNAPQPLSSWSRREWEPRAEELGYQAFETAAVDEQLPVSLRIRAIEILTEKFGGLDQELAEKLAAAKPMEVRARTAWSLGRTRPEAVQLDLLVRDREPFVQRQALEALLGAPKTAIDAVADSLAAAAAGPDKFVRMAAARVMARLSPAAYKKCAVAAVHLGWQASIPLAAAFAERAPDRHAYPVDVATQILSNNHPIELKREAVRLLQIGLGDVAPPANSVPGAFEGYASRMDLATSGLDLAALNANLAKWFGSGDDLLDKELGRVIAMVQPPDSELLTRVVAKITPESHPVDDLHWLIIAARIPASRTPETRTAIAGALVDLDAKIKTRSLPLDSSWDELTRDMYFALLTADEALPVAILENPNFGRAAHVPYVGGLSPDRFPDAIAAFLKQIESDPDYVWNSDVIFLLSHSTKPEVQELWRSKFDDPGLRNAVLMTLAEEPKEADRPQFIAGLENAPLDVLAECIRALLLLEPSQAAEEQVTLVRLLRRLDSRGMEREIRDQIVEVLQRNTSQHFDYSLGREGDPQQAGIEQWTAYIREAHPDEFAKQAGESAAELAQLEELLSQVSWEEGSASRGSKLFESRACIQCHSSRQALGPDLNGCAQRFSKEDLFTAIAVPSRDVSPRYQTTMIATVDGKVFTGLIVYESVDGLVLRNATNQTFRIEAKNIESRKTLSQSLMPNGLLKNMQPRDLADLYAFLRGMGAKTASAAPAEIRD